MARVFIDKGYFIEGREIEGPGGPYTVVLEYQLFDAETGEPARGSYRGEGTFPTRNRLVIGDSFTQANLEEYTVATQATSESWQRYRGFAQAIEDKREIKEGSGKKYYAMTHTWWDGYREGWREKREATKKTRSKNAPERILGDRPITRKDYPGVFADTDEDTIPDVDDPRPTIPGDVDSIEEVRLTDELGALIDERQRFVPVSEEVQRQLREIGGRGVKVQGRVKTPYSIINKLRRKRLQTLTDIAGTRIVVKDQTQLDKVDREIPRRFEVVERVDFYKTPQAGYRAIHYIVLESGLPVEIQLKTERMLEISEAAHDAYKRGELDGGAMERLTALAMRADRGDRASAREVDRVLSVPTALRRALRKDSDEELARKLARGES